MKRNDTYHTLIKQLAQVGMLLGVVVAYAYVFLMLDRGISVDEGYYLQGYVQSVRPSNVSLFHVLIPKLFFYIDFTNPLLQRWFYTVISLFVFLFFVVTTHFFLKKTLSLRVHTFSYYVLFFSVWLLSYCFATPMLYYDTLQTLLFLIGFSFFFLTLLSPKYQSVFLLCLGLLFTVSLLNYLPSGLIFIFMILLLYYVYKALRGAVLFYISLGMAVGVFLYHFYVFPLSDTFNIIWTQIKSANSVGQSGHDTMGLLSQIIVWLQGALAYTIPIVFIYYILFSIQKKRLYPTFALYLLHLVVLFAVLCLSYMLKKQLGTTLLLYPFAVLGVSCWVFGVKKTPNSKLLLTAGVFFIIPICGFFGTNQSLAFKSFYLSPFLALSFILILFHLCKSKFLFRSLTILMFVQVFILFSYYGYFKRYHNYYGMKSSNTHIADNSRLANIKISKHQQAYIERIDSLLRTNDFHRGDSLLAFEVDLAVVYAVGGVVPQPLYYAHQNMIQHWTPPQTPIKYILLYRRADETVKSFLKNSSWDFPQAYTSYQVGKFTQNMEEGQSSILYIRKKR